MTGVELGVLIVTSVLSGLDLVVNIFNLCLSGRVRCSCFKDCFTFEHRDNQTEPTPRELSKNQVDDIEKNLERRFSNPEN